MSTARTTTRCKNGAIACSRHSDSRERRTVGSKLNCTPGKRGGGGRGGGGISPLFFFLHEFFSRALLPERLEQANGANADLSLETVKPVLALSHKIALNALSFSPV